MRPVCPTAAARSAVARRFGLAWDAAMQDWEIEVSDARRVEEFLDGVSSFEDAEQLVSLLELILASLDERLVEHPDSGRELSAPHLGALRELGERFAGVVDYWVSADLPVSPLIARLMGRPPDPH